MEKDLENLLDAMPKTDLEIGENTYKIPIGQPLLRGLQYVELKGAHIKVTRGPFCWNGDCRSCVCDIESGGIIKTNQRICRFRVKESVVINKINDNFDYKQTK